MKVIHSRQKCVTKIDFFQSHIVRFITSFGSASEIKTIDQNNVGKVKDVLCTSEDVISCFFLIK